MLLRHVCFCRSRKKKLLQHTGTGRETNTFRFGLVQLLVTVAWGYSTSGTKICKFFFLSSFQKNKNFVAGAFHRKHLTPQNLFLLVQGELCFRGLKLNTWIHNKFYKIKKYACKLVREKIQRKIYWKAKHIYVNLAEKVKCIGYMNKSKGDWTNFYQNVFFFFQKKFQLIKRILTFLPIFF